MDTYTFKSCSEFSEHILASYEEQFFGFGFHHLLLSEIVEIITFGEDEYFLVTINRHETGVSDLKNLSQTFSTTDFPFFISFLTLFNGKRILTSVLVLFYP